MSGDVVNPSNRSDPSVFFGVYEAVSHYSGFNFGCKLVNKVTTAFQRVMLTQFSILPVLSKSNDSEQRVCELLKTMFISYGMISDGVHPEVLEPRKARNLTEMAQMLSEEDMQTFLSEKSLECLIDFDLVFVDYKGIGSESVYQKLLNLNKQMGGKGSAHYYFFEKVIRKDAPAVKWDQNPIALIEKVKNLSGISSILTSRNENDKKQVTKKHIQDIELGGFFNEKNTYMQPEVKVVSLWPPSIETVRVTQKDHAYLFNKARGGIYSVAQAILFVDDKEKYCQDMQKSTLIGDRVRTFHYDPNPVEGQGNNEVVFTKEEIKSIQEYATKNYLDKDGSITLDEIESIGVDSDQKNREVRDLFMKMAAISGHPFITKVVEDKNQEGSSWGLFKVISYVRSFFGGVKKEA